MSRVLDLLFLLAIATVTWAVMRFETGPVATTWSDLLIAAFLLAFAIDRIRRRDSAVAREAAVLAGLMLAFLAVYLCGFFDLSSSLALSLWVKGILAWLAHALFLVTGVAHIARRGREFYVRTFRWLVGGIVACCVYGLIQLAVKVGTGINLDSIVVGTLTLGLGKTTGINVYGQVAGAQNVYRINSLTGDPNHLGVMLCFPLLALLPLYLADRRGRRRLGLMLAFMFVVQVLTLSRSAALGDVVGLAVLLPFVWPMLPSARTIGLALGAVAVSFAGLYSTSSFVQKVVHSRTQTGGRGTAIHFQFYELVPPALDPNPLFGMGFNTFADFYQYVTGKADFSPHSFWIATLVETGMVGLCVYLVYFAYLILAALSMRRSQVPEAAQIGAGLVASLIGTAAANFFYLTMQFPYFFVLALIVVCGMRLYGPAAVPGRRPAYRAAGTLAG
jgi:hypothetical protein